MVNSANNIAYKYIYEGILSGRFPMGFPIVEGEIGVALGLSRSPVREALRRMEMEGLVKLYPGRGTFVTDLTQHDLEEIFDLRFLLELHALETACKYMEDEVLIELETNFLELTDSSEPQQYYDANARLHFTIIEYGGNSRMIGFYNMLSSQLAVVNRISSRYAGHFKESKKEHFDIIKALKRRDIEKARHYLSDHLNRVRVQTIDAFQNPSINVARKKFEERS